jgi:4'-phosphopantetheinyl transferase EntD
MALIDIRQVSPSVRLGLWTIDDTYVGSPRVRERQAVHDLLVTMMHNSAIHLLHNDDGKPLVAEDGQLLPSWQVSVSHTRGYAAVMLSQSNGVGVDIEYRSQRVDNIASRFIRPDEPASTTDERLLVWSAKETVYKLFSARHLAFFDMRTVSIGDKVLLMENMKDHILVDVGYEFSHDYVLTFASMALSHSSL